MTPQEKLRMLNATLERCRNSEFYRGRLPDKPLEDLPELKSLPFTTKEDVRSHSPFGFVCVTVSELYQYHETFGTTGTPASVWLTREDVADMAERVNLGGIGFCGSDVVLVRFPYAISTIAHFTHTAAQAAGACVIPASSRTVITPFPRVVDMMRRLKVTVLAALPLQALLIAETARMLGLDPCKDFPALRAIYTAGEVMTDCRRRTLEEAWRVPVLDNYGMTETGPMAVDCRHGCLHVLEGHFLFEVLDDSLNHDVATGETGHLVITTLTRRGMPLVRYLTGDRVRFQQTRCECGREMALQVRGRACDVLKVAGKSLDIWDLSAMVEKLPFRRFWAAGPYHGGLKLVVEQEKTGNSCLCDANPDAALQEAALLEPVVRELERKVGFPLEVEPVPAGTLVDRKELLAVGEVGKPRYLFSEEELDGRQFSGSARI